MSNLAHFRRLINSNFNLDTYLNYKRCRLLTTFWQGNTFYSTKSSKLEKEEDMAHTRNIGIIAHIDAGKTTTTERILYYSGFSNHLGEVHDGNTVMDYMEQERDRGITITSAAITYHWNKHKVNLIDTPGHVDFTVEVERALRVLDGAVVILDSSAGVEAQTMTVWRQANRYHIPSLMYLNKLDKVGASVERSINSIRDKLKIEPYLITYPYEGNVRNFKSLVDVVEMKKHVWDVNKSKDGRVFTSIPITEKEDGKAWEVAVERRTSLIGALSDYDVQLADEVLLETPMENINSNIVRRALRKATLKRKLAPVFCGSALKNKGIQPLLDGINHYLPSPKDVDIDFAKYYGTNLCAYAFKTIHDRVDKKKKPTTFFRIYSGSLRSSANIYNASKKITEKVNTLLTISADEFQRISEATAGNIVAVVGLNETVTGDTISSSKEAVQSATRAMRFDRARKLKAEKEKAAQDESEREEPVEEVWHKGEEHGEEEHEDAEHDMAVLAGIEVPSPVFSCSIEPPSMAYQRELDVALKCLQREDPSLKVEVNKDTGQTIMSGMGELHLEIIKNRILKEYKVDAYVGPLQVAYRETITQEVDISHTLESTIGGKDQHVTMTLGLHPVKNRPKFSHIVLKLDQEFSTKHHGSDFHRHQLQALESGVRTALEYGPLLNFPVINVDVSLLHLEVGKKTTHPFVTACANECIHKALRTVQTILLEPMMKLVIHVAEDKASAVMSDLSGRRSRIVEVHSHGDERYIEAEAPLSELLGYSTQIRILASGNCTFTMELSHYAPMSEQDQIKAIEAVTGFAPT